MSTQQPISSEQLEEIERYLQQAMEPAEKQAFEARMQTDEQLNAWTEETRLLLTGISETVLQQRLDHFHTNIDPGKVIRMPQARKWMAAASVLLIAALAAWLLFFRAGITKDVFAQYFYPDPGLASTMGVSDNYLFDRAMIDYKTGQYDAAFATWDSLRLAQPNNDTLNYFSASACLAAGHADKAIPLFKKVLQQPTSVFTADANWYLGLAFIKTGKKEEAIPYIDRSGHAQKKELLEKIK